MFRTSIGIKVLEYIMKLEWNVKTGEHDFTAQDVSCCESSEMRERVDLV